MLIIVLAGMAPCRHCPLSSNVRRTQFKVRMRCPPEVISQVQHCRKGRAFSLPLPAGAGVYGARRGLGSQVQHSKFISGLSVCSRTSSPLQSMLAGAGYSSFAPRRTSIGAHCSPARLAQTTAFRMSRPAQTQGTPNHSLKRSAIGRAPGPRGCRAYHQPRGPGTLPLSPA